MIRELWIAAAAFCGMALIAPCRADSNAAVIACRSVTDATARLACFDRETAHLDAKPVASAAPMPVAPPPDPKKQFGLPEKAVATQEVAAGTRSADAAKIEAKVLNYSINQSGRGVFALDNDQVWRQVVSTGDMLVKVGDAVVISRGALGSFWLSTASGRGCKVSRVR